MGANESRTTPVAKTAAGLLPEISRRCTWHKLPRI